MSKFSKGDRVRLNPENADGYIQPWPARIRKGLVGTISGHTRWGYSVQFDYSSRVKNKHDWYWTGVRESDLLPENEG